MSGHAPVWKWVWFSSSLVQCLWWMHTQIWLKLSISSGSVTYLEAAVSPLWCHKGGWSDWCLSIEKKEVFFAQYLRFSLFSQYFTIRMTGKNLLGGELCMFEPQFFRFFCSYSSAVNIAQSDLSSSCWHYSNTETPLSFLRHQLCRPHLRRHLHMEPAADAVLKSACWGQLGHLPSALARRLMRFWLSYHRTATTAAGICDCSPERSWNCRWCELIKQRWTQLPMKRVGKEQAESFKNVCILYLWCVYF